MKRFMDVLAITGSVVGALLVASKRADAQLIGYIFFVIGSSASMWLLLRSTASRSLLFINIYFVMVNVWGIINRIGV